MSIFVKTYYPDIVMSGYIQFSQSEPEIYNVYAGVDAIVGNNYLATPDCFSRGYFSYDTSNIPNAATITGLRWDLSFYGLMSYEGPSDWINSLYIGTWIGSSLDSSDWGGGTLDQVIGWPGKPGAPACDWITMQAGSYALVNKMGYTDIAFRDVSDEAAPWGYWQIVCYIVSRACRLEVTYEYESAMSAQNKVASNWGR